MNSSARHLDDYPDVLTCREASEICRVHPNTLYAHIRCGTLRAVSIGRRKLIPKKALEAFLSGNGTTEARSTDA